MVIFFGSCLVFLAISHIFQARLWKMSRRVDMTAWVFSPGGNNLCQFMTSRIPKPKFFANFHLGLVAAPFFFLPKLTFGHLEPFKGPPCSAFWPLWSLSAILVLHAAGYGYRCGYGYGRSLNPQPGPPPMVPRSKIRRSGTQWA